MKRLATASILILAFILVADILLCFVYPDVGKLAEEHPDKTAFMRYRERQWAKEGRDMEITRKWVPLRKVSPYVIKAVLIGEDDKFWHHEGFDYAAMEQAMKRDLKERKLAAGGSTISQQLAKNLYLSPSKNPLRKVKEAIYTWRIEKTLTKRRIMELYLNSAEWGDGIFGIEAASRHYYGKHASNLTPKQAARLAAVLPNPIVYDPTGNQRYVRNRSRHIYRIMVRRGIVIPGYEAVMHPPRPEPTPEAERGLSADTSGLNPETPAEAAPEAPTDNAAPAAPEVYSPEASAAPAESAETPAEVF